MLGNILKNEWQVKQEAATLLVNNSKKSSITAFLVAVCLISLIFNHVSVLAALAWLGSIIISYQSRSIIGKRFLQDKNKTHHLEKWLDRFRLACTASGIAWGFAAYLVYFTHSAHSNDDLLILSVVTICLAGICAAASISLSLDTRSAVLFSAGLWFTALPAFLLLNNDVTNMIIVLIAVFIVFVGIASKQLAQGIIQSIRLRFEAQDNEKKIVALTQRQSLHLEHTPMGVIEWDENLRVSTWNKACSTIFGYSNTEAIGKHISFFMPLFGSMQTQDIVSCLQKQTNQLKTYNHTNQQAVYCELSSTILKDEAGNFVGMASLVQDKTESIASQEKINQLAFFDALTGLPNRSLLLDRINQTRLNSKDNQAYSMLAFIDLDNFKSINDLQGHEAGDYLLQTIANRLQNNIRKQDTAARLGGDEFVLVLSGVGNNQKEAEVYVKKIIEKIAKTVKEPIDLSGYHYQCSASIGICLFNSDDIEAEELLRRADMAMYLSKKQGRNNYQFYDANQQPEYEYTLKLKHDLNEVANTDQLELYLQGQYDRNSTMLGAEALLRWNHPEHGLVMPNEFIPLAEETGAIVSIGNWVLNRACSLLKKWQSDESTADLMISVNVSAIQFDHPDFIKQLEKAINKSGCNASKLCIELTESAVITHIDESIAKMHQIKALGVSLAIDDFGTGYSSLSALKNLPLNELKIDKSFVKDFTKSSIDLTIVQTILQMGKNLNLRVVAEGVETESQMAYLSNYGCNTFQGYFFAKPCSIDRFESSIDKQTPNSQLMSKKKLNNLIKTKKTSTATDSPDNHAGFSHTQPSNEVNLKAITRH